MTTSRRVWMSCAPCPGRCEADGRFDILPSVVQRTNRRGPANPASAARNLPPTIELVLYVSAVSRYSDAAKRNCELLLSRFDRRRVRFEVCDVSEHPDRAEADAVCYTPMLVKRNPPPRAYVLGDLSNVTALIDLLESCGLDLMR